MRLRTVILLLVGALALVGTFPESSVAEDEKGSVKKKKKAKKKRNKRKKKSVAKKQADEMENPYSSEGEAAAGGGDSDGEGLSADEDPESEGALAADDASALDQGGGLGASLEEKGSFRRSSRMEFDERLVKGEAAKSGAVYLFKRVPRRLPGLVALRRSYRRRIVEPVLGQRELKAAVYSEEAPEPGEEEEEPASEAPFESSQDSATEADADKASESGDQ